MIVFSAFTPHSPLLLASVNKTKLEKVEKTSAAMRLLADELYAARPDVLVVLSSHGTTFDDAFSINLHEEYRVDLKEFGDLTAHRTFLPHLKLIDNLQRSLRHQQMPVTLSSDEILDYGAAVPLLLLTEHLPDIKIVPITFSSLSAKEHFQFGEALKEVLSSCHERVAVIGSGDLSHALETTSPAGFDKHGPLFDKTVQECVVNRNVGGLLKLAPSDVTKAKECAYRPLLMLLGLMERIHCDPVVHSYEAPFGVGFLVVHFELA